MGLACGLKRCTHPTCARAYPHSLYEHDAKNGTLCSECRKSFRTTFGQQNKFPRPYGRGILRDGQARPTSSDTSIHGVTPVVLRRNNKSDTSNDRRLIPPKGSFIGAVILFGIVAILSGIRFLVYQQKLMNYLLTHHTEKWKELTTFLGYGPGYANTFRGSKFLSSKDDLGDPEVLRLKVIVRNSYKYMVGGVLTTFVTIAMMACLY